jgi:hypothetical protein
MAGLKFAQRVKEDILKSLRSSNNNFENRIKNIQNESLLALEIPDEGFLDSNTRVLLRFKTGASDTEFLKYRVYTATKVFYANNVIDGTGVHDPFGPRPYLKNSANAVYDFITTGRYKLPTASGGRNKSRTSGLY